MKDNHITYQSDLKNHKNFVRVYKNYVQNEILKNPTKKLEEEINKLIYDFENEHHVTVDFEKSNITKRCPSKERMNLCLFIDLSILLDDDK